MPKCFTNSLLTMALFFAYLFLFDFVWYVVPDLSTGFVLIGTLLMIVGAFKLAMMTATKFFRVTRC